MTSKLLYSHILLDRSGSMESCRDSTISAFNEYVKGLKDSTDIDAAVSLTLFDTMNIDLVFNGIKVGDMPALSRETFVPRGGTPLNDAIVATLDRMQAEWHRPGEAITLVILTDGEENSSKTSTATVKERLAAAKAAGWMVIYLGANQDAFHEGGMRGIAAGNTMNFSTANVKSAMGSVLRSTRAYAMTGDAVGEAQFTDEERKDAVA